MSKFALAPTSIALLGLLLITGCAEDNKEAESAPSAIPAAKTTQTKKATNKVAKPTVEQASQKSEKPYPVMDQPVDFSSPESIEKSFDVILQQAGESEVSKVRNAIGHMMVYDLSVKRNKETLYKKLNGRTPNEILAMVRR